MVHLFQPKHQKLILQCYPPGRGFDKKPNSSELSYLLYYASTRRVKLEKVGRFLQKKNESDVYRNRTGNVQVTLEIILQLIKKCPDDLNVFADNINSIFLSILKTKDLALCQQAVTVFDSYCATLDGELFTGDLEFVHNFTNLANSFFNLGVDVSEANKLEWKAISLKAAGSIAHCQIISQGSNAIYIVKKAIALLGAEIHKSFDEENLLKRSLSHSSETQQMSNHDLSRFNTARTSNVKLEDFDNQTPSEVALDEIAINSLKPYFHTSSTNKLRSSTVALADYLVQSNVEPSWSAALVEMIATWIPVQMRFMLLAILTTRLDKNGHDNEQIIYIRSISSVLASSVNLVGLPVIDNLKQFCHIQKHHILNSHKQTLINEYTVAIESLATHVYYQDQIIDIIGELLIKVKDANNVELVLALLKDIGRVLTRSHSTRSVQRALVPIELYADTFPLLRSENPSIQKAYLDVLILELDLEYDEKTQYLRADYDGLISSARGSILNLFYEQLELVSYIDDPASLLKLLDLINVKFGINSIVNFIPFFFQWQLLSDDLAIITKKEILNDSIAFVNLFIAAKASGNEELAKTILEKIDYRKLKSIWAFEGFPLVSGTASTQLILTKEQLVSMINDFPWKDYEETILSSHYRYLNIKSEDAKVGLPEGDETADVTIMSNANASQNLSFSMFLQSSAPPSINMPNEANSIKSMPLSARSILFNGKLNVPRVQELRKAISGADTKRLPLSTTSLQKTDVVTLLDELDIESDLNNRGNLTAR